MQQRLFCLILRQQLARVHHRTAGGPTSCSHFLYHRFNEQRYLRPCSVNGQPIREARPSLRLLPLAFQEAETHIALPESEWKESLTTNLLLCDVTKGSDTTSQDGPGFGFTSLRAPFIFLFPFPDRHATSCKHRAKHCLELLDQLTNEETEEPTTNDKLLLNYWQTVPSGQKRNHWWIFSS